MCWEILTVSVGTGVIFSLTVTFILLLGNTQLFFLIGESKLNM